MAFWPKSQRDAPETGPMTPKGFMSVESALNLEAHLQQPVEDSTVITDLTMLQNYIEAHTTTTSFYRKDRCHVNVAELGKHIKDKVLKGTTEDAAALTSILFEPQSRATGIRIVITRILFDNIDFFGNAQQTLLSPSAVYLMSKFKSKERPTESQESYQLALARWRVLTTFLLHNSSHFKASDKLARRMIDTIDCVLAPFIDGQHTGGKGRERREKNLAMIISHAERIGTMLFAQPTTWEFNWDRDPRRRIVRKGSKRSSRRQEGFAVYPAIWKTGDLEGRKLSKNILTKPPELDSSKATIASAAMDLGEDTFKWGGNPLQRREVDEAITNIIRPERLDKQPHANDTSIATTDTVVREENSLLNPIGAERIYKQHWPSNPSLSNSSLSNSSLSNRDMDILKQNRIPEFTAADMNPTSNKCLTAKQGCKSSAKAVAPDSIAAGGEHGQQPRVAESEETTAANSERLERSHRPVQQRYSSANEHGVEPISPKLTTQPDDSETAPTLAPLRETHHSGDWEGRHEVRQRTEKSCEGGRILSKCDSATDECSS